MNINKDVFTYNKNDLKNVTTKEIINKFILYTYIYLFYINNYFRYLFYFNY